MYFIFLLLVNFGEYVYYFRIVFCFKYFKKNINEAEIKIILHFKCTQM